MALPPPHETEVSVVKAVYCKRALYGRTIDNSNASRIICYFNVSGRITTINRSLER